MTPSGPIRLVHLTTVPQTLYFLRGQVAYMKSRGLDVSAVSSPGPELEKFADLEGVPVHAVEMPRRITPLGDLVALVRLVRLFRKIRPHIVHAHTPKGGLLGMIAAWIVGVRARVYTIHGLPLETATGRKRTLLRWTEKISCALARRVTAVSESVRRRAAAAGVCRAERIVVLGAGTVNGVDAERRFAPSHCSYEAAAARRACSIPQEVRVLGFVGRLVRDKGVEDLAAAWTELREEYPDLHLLIAGDYEPRDPVSESTRERLRSDPRVRLVGHVESTRPLYSIMDVVALPTYREGFPQVPLEAAAMERPVVASRVTGCVDAVVDGETGTLVEARDPHALVLAIREYLERPELRRAHGTAGRARVLRDFRPENLWLLTHWEYLDLLGLVRSRGRRRAPSRRPIDLLLKRVIDIAGAALGLVLLGPILLAVAFLVRLCLGRPIFFRHRRPGLKGKVFTLLKFRTMHPGKEADAARTPAIGRLLRSTSLDEIPQLWNVLVGDMSLVGPRPLLIQYLSRYTPSQARRHDVRPGMTGWVQVNGRNSLEWDRKFEMDVWYVDNGSLWLDLKILLQTVWRVLGRKGITGPGGQTPVFRGGDRAGETVAVSLERPARG